ncbi:hypothetical protein GOODEAATRI_004476 [Goodea atripinnis]|uniref:Uncharacterized protein n=1 Tax=Goodea atripinnis TaxID=208336 RepID=A0ABV0PV81_9TELE
MVTSTISRKNMYMSGNINLTSNAKRKGPLGESSHVPVCPAAISRNKQSEFLCRCCSLSMAPKRRAASAAQAGGKKVKEEPKDAFTSTKEALLAAGPQNKGKRKVDEHLPDRYIRLQCHNVQ